MKYVKILGLAAVAAMAMMAFTAASASATTLEVNGGATLNSSVAIEASVESGTKVILKDTAGFSKNECSTSNVSGSTASPFTGSSVTGAISTLTFENCTRTVDVHSKGSLEVTYTSGTNGSVASENAEVTVGSSIGTLTCVTGETTKIGTLTGTASGKAKMDINAVLNCGIIPSAKWEGAYTVTGANAALGVSS
jgi:hypothetical protein